MTKLTSLKNMGGPSYLHLFLLKEEELMQERERAVM
jgi:hypothetical protein